MTEDLSAVVTDLAAKAKVREHDERIDVMVRVLSALYDKAMAYTNLIVVAGFAGFFAIWGSMKEHLSQVEMFASALCVTISLTLFIFWEVFGMVVRSRNLKELLVVLQASPEEFDSAFAEQQKAEQYRNLWVLRIWVVILTLTVVPAILAAAMLIFAFGRLLWAAF